MSDPATDFDPMADLLDVLDLRQLPDAAVTVAGSQGDDYALGDPQTAVFEGRSQPMPHGRVFGGQVLAQSVVAAGRTVADLDGGARRIHSLHGYFIRPGDASKPIRFAVERLMDGNSFSTRRVHAIQHGRVILSMITSFQLPADGVEHQDPMPQVPSPEGLPSPVELMRATGNEAAVSIAERRPIEVRNVQAPIYLEPDPDREAAQSVWIKAIGRLPDDPLIHAAVLAYTSDYTLLEPGLRRHGISWADPRLRIASLDHAMWFHRPGRIDEWVLYIESSPSAQSGRVLGRGQMFSADGVLIASVAQEGMLRLKE